MSFIHAFSKRNFVKHNTIISNEEGETNINRAGVMQYAENILKNYLNEFTECLRNYDPTTLNVNTFKEAYVVLSTIVFLINNNIFTDDNNIDAEPTASSILTEIKSLRTANSRIVGFIQSIREVSAEIDILYSPDANAFFESSFFYTRDSSLTPFEEIARNNPITENDVNGFYGFNLYYINDYTYTELPHSSNSAIHLTVDDSINEDVRNYMRMEGNYNFNNSLLFYLEFKMSDLNTDTHLGCFSYSNYQSNNNLINIVRKEPNNFPTDNINSVKIFLIKKNVNIVTGFLNTLSEDLRITLVIPESINSKIPLLTKIMDKFDVRAEWSIRQKISI